MALSLALLRDEHSRAKMHVVQLAHRARMFDLLARHQYIMDVTHFVMAIRLFGCQ